MTQDNTKDPVRVLREAVDCVLEGYTLPHEVRKILEIAMVASKPSIADSAAIPHSEQRETVAAGEATDYKLGADERIFYSRLARPIMIDGLPFMTDSDQHGSWDVAMVFGTGEKRPRRIFLERYYQQFAAPVAAPVPEAKAEQDATIQLNEGSSMPVDMTQAKRWIIQLRQRVDTLLGIINAPAAPAVKHEASELPPLPEPTIEGSVMHPELLICYRTPLHFTADQTRAYGQACIAHQMARIRHLEHERDIARAALAAPPIAVQGSIGEDAAPTKAMLLEAIDDKVARSEDLMSDFRPYRAMERWNEASATLKDIVNRLFDSRSPVAAAPSQLQEAQAECWKRGARISELEVMLTSARDAALEEAAKVCEAHDSLYKGASVCADAIRALSAAAPSTDPEPLSNPDPLPYDPEPLADAKQDIRGTEDPQPSRTDRRGPER